MVASISNISNSGAAASYYAEVDDYYKSEGAPTAWQGKGAEVLGLAGGVDSETFTVLLEGRLPDGTQLGRTNAAGEIEHRPGWDITFSAPKSVSALALVARDERVIAAHERAVNRALAWLESEAATARSKALEKVGKAQASDNLVIAKFRHATSREQDPQLHSHCVILNMTQTRAGWKSIESKPFFRLQKEVGELYRQELAHELRAAGYLLDTKNIDGTFTFEVQGVPAALLQHWSSRSKQVEQALAARGKDRDSATAAEKEVAVLDTRAAKEAIDHEYLREHWKSEAKAMGHDLAAVVENAKYKLPTPEHIQAQAKEAAVRAVHKAAEHLAERTSRFSTRDLEKTARSFARGEASLADIRHAIIDAENSGALIRRQTRAYDVRTGLKDTAKGYTTLKGAETERKMLASVQRLNTETPAIATPEMTADAIKRQEQIGGYAFNKSQRAAATGILTDTRRLHIVQGYAGTAKTTSVLAAVAAQGKARGLAVRAFAPTASAANTLGTEIGSEGTTVAAHLHKLQPQTTCEQLWIIDEAGLLSASDMQRLLAKAEKAQARVVLVGDTQQLGSVEAGAAFRQIQEQGDTRVYELTEIVRQQNQNLKDAVYRAIAGDAAAVLEKIESGAGKVNEIWFEDKEESRAARVEAIVHDYTQQSVGERERSLIIAPGKDDRAQINLAVREKLKEQGAIAGDSIAIVAVETKDLTTIQAKTAEHYVIGDMLKAQRAYESLSLRKGEFAKVISVDAQRNRITVDVAGKSSEINPARFTGLQPLEAGEREIAAGDKLILRAHIADLRNGTALTVTDVDLQKRQIVAVTARGNRVTLDASQPLPIDYGYALTAHQAQGKTVDSVFVHAESQRLNLQTQQQLYVAVSRARHQAHLYTDNQKKLVDQIRRESGQKETSLARALGPPLAPPSPPLNSSTPPQPSVGAAHTL